MLAAIAGRDEGKARSLAQREGTPPAFSSGWSKNAPHIPPGARRRRNSVLAGATSGSCFCGRARPFGAVIRAKRSINLATVWCGVNQGFGSAMRSRLFDFSPCGWGRVWAGSVIGTLACMAVAFAIDSYSLVLGVPFFGYLLGKQRQLALAHKELMVVASTDALTSCLNRRAFVTLVERYLDRMEHQRTDDTAALLVIDIDHFKQINDTFGHDCGDVALAKVAHAIKDSVREFDVVGRIGGEEFCVLLPGASQERAATIAERIRSNVFETDLALAGETRRVSVSVGGVTFDHDKDVGALLRTADQRLYAAKRAGRNRVILQQFPQEQAMSIH